MMWHQYVCIATFSWFPLVPGWPGWWTNLNFNSPVPDSGRENKHPSHLKPLWHKLDAHEYLPCVSEQFLDLIINFGYTILQSQLHLSNYSPPTTSPVICVQPPHLSSNDLVEESLWTSNDSPCQIAFHAEESTTSGIHGHCGKWSLGRRPAGWFSLWHQHRLRGISAGQKHDPAEPATLPVKFQWISWNLKGLLNRFHSTEIPIQPTVAQ